MKNKLFYSFIFTFFVSIFCTGYISYIDHKTEQKIKINNLEWKIADLRVDIDYQQNIVEFLKNEIIELNSHETRTRRVKVTFYVPELGGINADNTPDKTATMQNLIVGWTCAISRDLVDIGWLGKRIYIKGIGIRQATDIMGTSINGKSITNQIDILIDKTNLNKEIKKLGKNIDILATIL